MNKIYCKNCKYFRQRGRSAYHRWDKDFPFCKVHKKKVHTFGKIKTEYGGFPNIMNENNDCKNYKRKWWKFWLRKNEIS